ncbi:MAG: hypothetical protein Kow0069_26490 [Promethearchaeota archaeon]
MDVHTSPDELLSLVRLFNRQMRQGVRGPSCVGATRCPDDCCSIHVDVPRPLVAALAATGELDLERGVVRAGPFGHQLGVDASRVKCVLHDPETGGCRVHFSGLKPPQCFLYPTGFSRGPKPCKVGRRWTFPDTGLRKAANLTFQRYLALCLEWGDRERSRLAAGLQVPGRGETAELQGKVAVLPPRMVAGLRLTSAGLVPLMAEGTSLSVRRFCATTSEGTCGSTGEFLSCRRTCAPVASAVVRFACQAAPWICDVVRDVDHFSFARAFREFGEP